MVSAPIPKLKVSVADEDAAARLYQQFEQFLSEDMM
jgi:hypothetical protein